MAAITFRLRAGRVPASKACFTSVQGMLETVEQFMEVQGPEGMTVAIISADAPTTEDHDKIWVKLNSNGTPEGIYTYDDGWKRAWNMQQKMIMLWTGAVADIPAGWHLADGVAPSTKDLTDPTDYGDLWKPNYTLAGTTYDLCPIEFVGYP